MRKLIKPKRERMRSLTLTPSRSESGDGLALPPDSQDSSSIGSGSNSLDDTLIQKRSNSEYMTWPQMNNQHSLKTQPIGPTIILSLLSFKRGSYREGFSSDCVWFKWGKVEDICPPLTAPLLLYLSHKGGEGSSPMPMGRVRPMV